MIWGMLWNQLFEIHSVPLHEFHPFLSQSTIHRKLMHWDAWRAAGVRTALIVGHSSDTIAPTFPHRLLLFRHALNESTTTWRHSLNSCDFLATRSRGQISGHIRTKFEGKKKFLGKFSINFNSRIVHHTYLATKKQCTKFCVIYTLRCHTCDLIPTVLYLQMRFFRLNLYLQWLIFCKMQRKLPLFL